MVNITQSTLLSTFSLIRSAILANATLAVKFNTTNIYEFEPKHKAMNFKGFPYIWVNLPSSDPEKVVFDNNSILNELEVSVFLRMDWEARANVLNYANALLKSVEDYESTFEASGYYDVMIEVIGVDPHQIIDQKDLVEVEFLITFRGAVNRA